MTLFSSKPTPKEAARTQQRELKTVNRDLEREDRNLQMEEKRLEAEIKALAKKGNEAHARQVAKQLIAVRAQRTRNMAMKSKVTGLGHTTQAMATQATMGKAMASSAMTMKAVGQQMNVQQMQATMFHFQRESDRMEMNSDMMNDAIDGVFESDEEEESEVMDKIFDEIGLEVKQSTAAVPTRRLPTKASEEKDLATEEDGSLERRLAALKGM